MEALAVSFDISPPSHLSTACHGRRNTESKLVAVPFEANILALREGDNLVVVVSLDWFFVSPQMRQHILDHCGGGLGEANLVIAASHAHTSPNTDLTKVGFSEVDCNYVARVEDAVAKRVGQIIACSEWIPVQLKFVAAECDSSVHRRRKIWWPHACRLRRITMKYPNPDGPRDKELRMLRVARYDGSALALLWGISCHPTEWPRTAELSSDYPGLVRQALQQKLGAELPVLFLQGFCGDLRPPAIGRWARRETLRVRIIMFLCSLVNGKCFAGWSVDDYSRWVDGIQRAAFEAVERSNSQEPMMPCLTLSRLTAPLSVIGLSGAMKEIAFHLIDIGEQLRFVGISAEVTWEYAEIVREIDSHKHLWPVGYIDHVFGYLPTEPMLSAGGYEVAGFQHLFGIDGEFVPTTEQAIRSCLKTLLFSKDHEHHGIAVETVIAGCTSFEIGDGK